MKLAKYRVTAGAYRVDEFLILRGGRSYWQVRDEFDDVIEEFDTLRRSLRYAQGLAAAKRSRGVKPATLPVELARMLRI